MKKIIGGLACLILMMLGTWAMADVSINEMNFPDDAFREYVGQFDGDHDGSLSDEETETVKNVRVYGEKYYDLTGLEYFTALEELTVSSTQVADLDLYDNTALKKIDCSACLLTELEIGQCKKLEELNCSNNHLTALNVSRNTALRVLKCDENDLSALNVSKNTALEELSCGENQLRSIDISANTLLKKLDCKRNKLTELTISKNRKLTELNCASNRLTKMDFSKNPALEVVSCANNQLTHIDVTVLAKLTELNCMTNQLTEVNLHHNPELLRLSCGANLLTGVDVSKNPKLIMLSCEENKLTGLNLEANPKLIVLICTMNQLSGLDVSRQRDLGWLICEHNRFRTLDVSRCRFINRLVNNSEPTYYGYANVKEWREYSQMHETFAGTILSTDSSVSVLTGRDEIPISGITLNKNEAALVRTSVKKNPTLQLKATIAPADATDKTLEWSSSNPKVARVNGKGKVTAVAAGEAVITCRAKDGSRAEARCVITVTDKPLTGIVLNLKKAVLKKGETLQLKVKTFRPAAALLKKVKWRSSDRKIAVVNSSGKVTARKKGECEILCIAADGSGVQAVCRIVVK